MKLYYTSDVDDDYTIKSDEHRIQQVLVNFLTNACKHTEKGEIHVHSSLTEKPGMITFSVTDTGTGVPADEAEHIFERFTKLNAFKQGAGLGLSICKTIATLERWTSDALSGSAQHYKVNGQSVLKAVYDQELKKQQSACTSTLTTADAYKLTELNIETVLS